MDSLFILLSLLVLTQSKISPFSLSSINKNVNVFLYFVLMYFLNWHSNFKPQVFPKKWVAYLLN